LRRQSLRSNGAYSHLDADTITIVGVVDRLTASEFPFEYVRGLELYVRVIDAAGEYPIRMEIIRVADEYTIARGEAVVSSEFLQMVASWVLLYS
jgi:hypothetical protein